MQTNGGLFRVSLSDRFNLPPSSSLDRVYNLQIFPEDVHVVFWIEPIFFEFLKLQKKFSNQHVNLSLRPWRPTFSNFLIIYSLLDISSRIKDKIFWEILFQLKTLPDHGALLLPALDRLSLNRLTSPICRL